MKQADRKSRRHGRRRRGTALLVAAAAAFAAQPASSFAGNLWDGGGTNNDWTTSQNWSPNGVPDDDGTAAITFAGAVRLTPNLDANRNILSLTFANPSGSFTLGSSNGSALTIGSGGITQNDNDPQTLNHIVTLGAPQTWNTAGGNLVVGGALNLGGHALTTAGAFTTNLSGVVSGTGGITHSGSGTLRLAGANTYNGGTTLSVSTLTLANNAALGTGGLTLGGGTVRYEGNLAIVNEIDVTAAATIAGPGSQQLSSVTFSGAGPLTFNNDARVSIAGSAAANFTGAIAVPDATLVLGRTAGTNVVGGNLSIGTASSLDSGYVLLRTNDQIHDAATVTVHRSGTLDLFEFKTSDTIANLALVEGRAATSNTGTLTVTGSVASSNVSTTVAGTANISGNLALGSATVPVTVTGTHTTGVVTAPNTLNLDAVVSGGALSFEGSAGRLNLNAANTNNGFDFKNFLGRVDVANASGLGTGTVTVHGGAFDAEFGFVGGGPMTVSNNFVLNAITSFDNAQDVTLTGTIGGSAVNVGKVGTGTLTLANAANTYDAPTSISGGAVSIAADGALGAVPVSFAANRISLWSGGTLHASANVTLAANRGITIHDGQTGRLRASPGVVFTPSKLTGSGNITFATSGPGTLATFPLTALNTSFTGKTIVDAAVVAISSNTNLSDAPTSLFADKLTLTNGGTLKVTATTALGSFRGVTLLNGGAGGAFEVDSAQTLTVNAPVAGPGNLTKRGPGTLVLVNTGSTYSGKTIIEGGTVNASADTHFGAAPASLVADQLTLNAVALRWTANGSIAATRGVRLAASSSTIQVDTGVTLDVHSPLSGPGGLTKTGTGTLNLFGANTHAGANSVGAGKVVLHAPFSTNTSVAVSAGATLELAQSPAVTLKTGSVTATGRLDVKNNKLILTAQPIGSWSGTAYTGVTGMIQSAFAGGAWSGNGITTSVDDAKTGLTTLAVATADQTGYAGGTFGGMSVASGNVLVMYTYAGDANLDGAITGDDYSVIDFNIAVPGARGYYNGDFNYDGVISGDDYSLIDFNIVAQGAPFPTSSSPSSLTGGVTAVPEPSACGFAILATSFLARRRRRRGQLR